MTERRSAARSIASGWTDPAFARVADAVHLVAGLVFPPNRQPTAESGMRRAMAALRLRDADALARAVERPGDARDAVLAELTVGETYFFRESAQLGVLGSEILPALTGRRGPDAPLRIWSAGCASGEEPYTLAIMLRELGWTAPARILGTDVARPRLDAARRGHYTRWSLRGVSPERVDRWFERRASHFLLRDDVRQAVHFAPLNLIADDYPSLEGGTAQQDLVLCRNVLIYFDMESVVHIATRLLAALAPDGWLLLGASDPPLAGLVPCEPVMTPGGMVYRRDDRNPARARSGTAFRTDAPTSAWQAPRPWAGDPVDASALPPAVLVVPAVPAVPAVPVAPMVDEALPWPLAPAGSSRPESRTIDGADEPRADTTGRDAATPSDADEWVARVRSLANAGQLREADEACMHALDVHRLVPELHLLHAMLLAAAGQLRESANASRRAVYLDRGFAMAHLQLGDALARLGERERARLAFESAASALSDHPDDRPVPAADGIVASRLRQTASRRLRGLREASA
jgi:chemotaxis protein methyltransferase CheR